MRLRLIRGHMDGGKADVERDYYALPAEESLKHARALLEGLYAGQEGFTGMPDVPPDRCDIRTRVAYGLCQECHHRALARFRYGTFELCRQCVRRRRNAADLAAVELKGWAA